MTATSKLTVKDMMSNPAAVCAAIMAVSCGSLAFALLMEYVFGLEPCILCIYQRWPFLMTAFLALIGLLLSLKNIPKASAFMVFLCAPIYLAGAVIAVYHSGVERHWWTSFMEGCAVNFAQSGDLLAQIEASKAVRCDQIPWSFLGLSMANWNIPLSAGLAVFCLVASILIARRTNGVLR